MARPRTSKKKPDSPLPKRSGSLTLSFGLVSLAVGYSPALQSGTAAPSGTTICTDHNSGVKRRWYCEAGKHETENTTVVFERGGSYVAVDRAESALEKTGVVPLERRVDVYEIDPLYYEKTYLLQPDAGYEPVYDLLGEALAQQERVLLGKTVLSKSTRMVAVRWSAASECMVMHVCVPESKIRWDDADLISAARALRADPDPAQLAAADTLLGTLGGEFEPLAEDDYAVALENAIAAAKDGKPIPQAAATVAAAPVVDLMAALQASVAAATAGKKPAAKKKVTA
jgi:DNA end-binding protein Ku